MQYALLVLVLQLPLAVTFQPHQSRWDAEQFIRSPSARQGDMLAMHHLCVERFFMQGNLEQPQLTFRLESRYELSLVLSQHLY